MARAGQLVYRTREVFDVLDEWSIEQPNKQLATNTYANAGKIAGGAAGTGGVSATGGESFGKMVQQAASSVMDTLGKSESASLQAVTGKADLTAVTEAVTNAQVA